MIIKQIYFCLIIVLLLICCSCGVKFETGQTPEEARASSQITANGIKSDWARLINKSSARDVGWHLKAHLDTISNRFVGYGFMLAEKWREGNEGRGENIPDSEMRSVIGSWISNDKPIINAWEDNIDYALRRMTKDGFYSNETILLFNEMIDHFNDIYNAVLFPTGDVGTYEDKLIFTKGETAKISRRLEIELNQY